MKARKAHNDRRKAARKQLAREISQIKRFIDFCDFAFSNPDVFLRTRAKQFLNGALEPNVPNNTLKQLWKMPLGPHENEKSDQKEMNIKYARELITCHFGNKISENMFGLVFIELPKLIKKIEC